MLPKYFDKECVNLWIRKIFLRFVLLYFPHLPQIILWATYQHETKKGWIRKSCMQSFPRRQHSTSTTMVTIDRETILPATQKSSHESQVCRIKTSRDKSSVIRKEEDLNSLDLIGLIEMLNCLYWATLTSRLLSVLSTLIVWMIYLFWDVLLICHPETCSSHPTTCFFKNVFDLLAQKLNSEPYQSRIRNLLKDVPSHLLQDLTPLMHPMLSNPPFKLCMNKGKANSEFEFHLNRIAREYQRRSHLNLILKKKQGDFCTQPLCHDCGEALHAKRPCPNKSIPNLDHLSMKACSRCGAEGHQSSQCTGNCPNCDIKHPTGECPSSDITCFLCESSTHVP
jgi:hypothetical protein